MLKVFVLESTEKGAHVSSSTKPPTAPVTQRITNLPGAAAELLEVARTSHARRAGRTLIPGAGAVLKQTLMALVAGEVLADHESPGSATLQVLVGAVRLTGGGDALELDTGDHVAIPPVRHGLVALEDAVVLITVGQGSRSQPQAPAGAVTPAGTGSPDQGRHGAVG